MDIELFQFTADIGGLLSLLLNAVLPLLVGLVTTRVTHARVKALLLLLLSFVTTFVLRWSSAHNDALPFDVASVGINVLVTFLIAGLMHMVAWKPFGAAAWMQDVSPPGLKRSLEEHLMKVPADGPKFTPGDTWNTEATQIQPVATGTAPAPVGHTMRVDTKVRPQ